MLRQIVLILIAALALCSPVMSQEKGDPIKAKLQKAKERYKADIEEVKNAIQKTLDKKEEEARQDGNKALLDKVKENRERFLNTGQLPERAKSGVESIPGGGGILRPIPVTDYEKKLHKAQDAMLNAYDEAIKQYIRTKQDALANDIEKEKKDHIQSQSLNGLWNSIPKPPGPTPVPRVLPSDKCQPGTVWTGLVMWKGDKYRQNYTFVVTERTNKKVKGFMKYGLPPEEKQDKGGLHDFEGEITEKNQLDTIVLRLDVGAEIIGTIMRDRFSFEMKSGGSSGSGEARLIK